jgi:2-methylisocitrate lyase-like PEP mutase family enzyme
MKKPDLKTLVRRGELIIAPGAYDAFSARIIAQRGFPAVYLTGYGTTAALLARPDIGFVSLTDMCGVVRNICQAIDVPLIADGESGFGNAVNLVRTVREYEMAGASAIHLEDQVVPKRYAGQELPQVVPADEHVEKIRCAVNARTRDDFLIIGRTDCIQRLGIDEAIRRGNAYRDAGADLVFVHGISTPEELRAVGQGVRGPKLVNYSALTLSPQGSPATMTDLKEWGFAVAIFAIEPLFAAAKALGSVLDAMATTDPAEALRRCMMPKAGVEAILDAGVYRRLEESHLPREGA